MTEPFDAPEINTILNYPVKTPKTGNARPAKIGDMILGAEAESTSIGFVLGALFDAAPRNSEEALQALDQLTLVSISVRATSESTAPRYSNQRALARDSGVVDVLLLLLLVVE